MIQLLALAAPLVFAHPVPAQDDALRAEVQAWLEEIVERCAGGDGDAWLDALDSDAFIERMGRVTGKRLGFLARGKFARELRDVRRNEVDAYTFDTAHGVHLLDLSPADPAEGWVALIQRVDEDHESSYERWWLRRDDDELRYYDWEDLATGMVGSRLYGESATSAEPTPYVRFYEELANVVAAVERGAWVSARGALRRMARLEVPDEVRAYQHFYAALVEMYQGELERALPELERGRTLGPPQPMLEKNHAFVCARLGHSEEALRSVASFREHFGYEAEVETFAGDAHFDLDQVDEALAAYRRALDLDPGEFRALTGYLELSAELELAEVERRLAASPLEEAPFDEFARLAHDISHGHLEALCAALEARAPDAPNVGYYRAEIALCEDRGADAAAAVLAALPRAPADELGAYLGLYARAVASAPGEGGAAAAYLPVQRYGLAALRAFCDDVVYADPAGVADIARGWCEVHPTDPWGPYVLAWSWIAAEEPERARAVLERVGDMPLENGPDRLADRYLSLRLTTACALGDAEAAYGALRNDEDWPQLLRMAYDGTDDALLPALVALRAADRPDDPSLPAWQGYAAFLTDDFEGALEHFARADPGQLDEEHVEYLWDFLVAHGRSAARLGRLEILDAAANELEERLHDPYLHALAAAARGDAPGARAVVDRCLEMGYGREWIRNDPDLASVVSHAVFADLDPAGTGETGDGEADDGE